MYWHGVVVRRAPSQATWMCIFMKGLVERKSWSYTRRRISMGRLVKKGDWSCGFGLACVAVLVADGGCRAADDDDDDADDDDNDERLGILDDRGCGIIVVIVAVVMSSVPPAMSSSSSSSYEASFKQDEAFRNSGHFLTLCRGRRLSPLPALAMLNQGRSRLMGVWIYVRVTW